MSGDTPDPTKPSSPGTKSDPGTKKAPPRPPSKGKPPRPPSKPKGANTLAGGTPNSAEVEALDVLDLETVDEVVPPVPPSKGSRPPPPRPPEKRKGPPRPKASKPPPRPSPSKAPPRNPKKKTKSDEPSLAAPRVPADLAPAVESAPEAPATPSPAPSAAAVPAAPELPPEPPAPAVPVGGAAPEPSPSPPVATPPDESAPPILELSTVPETLKKELSGKPDTVRAARLHAELGRLKRDPTKALDQFTRALAAVPDFVPAIRGARSVVRARGDIKRAAELYDAESKAVGGKRRRATLAFQKACDYEAGGKADHARSAFAEAAELDPDWPAGLRSHAYHELIAKDWNHLERAYAGIAGLVTEDPRYRAAMMVQRGRLLERRLRRPSDAIEQLRSALELDATTLGALGELQRMLYTEGRWRELAQLLSWEAQLTPDRTVQTLALCEMARIHADRLDEPAEAAAALQKASANDERNVAILEDLARLQERLGDVAGQADTLERLVVAVDRPTDQLTVYLRLGFLHLDRDDEAAIRWMEAALGVDAAHEPALQALDVLYRAREQWESLAAIHARAGQAPSRSVQRARHHAEAAAIYDRHLGRPDLAIQYYQHALGLDRHHVGSFHALVRLLTEGRRFAELAELYERAVDDAATEDIAVAYLFKVGSIHEDVLGNPQGAVAAYERILDKHPDHFGAIHALQRAAESASLFDKLVEALDREARLVKAPERVVELEHRAAVVVAERLDDPQEAIKRLDKLLHRSPKHLPSLLSLGQLYRRTGRFEELLSVLERQLPLLEAVDAKVSLHVSMAELCERELADPKRAVDFYQHAVEADPDHPLASLALHRALRVVGDHVRLAKVLAKQCKRASEASLRARLSMELGVVYEVHLDKPDDAIAAYRGALDAQPGHRAAMDGLVRVLSAKSAWKELDDVLDAQRAAMSDPRLARDAAFRSAYLQAERLNRTDDARETLQRIVQEDPSAAGALVALEHLAAAEGHDDLLAWVMAAQAEILGDRGARVAALTQRARLRSHAGDDAELRKVCTAIIASEKDNLFALERLEEVALRVEDRHLLSEVDSRFCDVLDDPLIRSFHHQRLADSQRRRNPTAALRSYQSAAADDPHLLGPIRGILDVGYAMGDVNVMVDAYLREARYRTDPVASADLLVQAGVLLAQSGRAGDGVGHLEEALQRCPDHVPAAQQLAVLLRPQHVERLIEQLSRAAHAAGENERRLALWLEVASLHADRRGDLGAAISAATRALETAPNDARAVMLLAHLHGRDQQHEEAARLLQRAVELDPKATDVHLELARIHTHHLPDAKKARKSLDKVLAERPDDREALAIGLRLRLSEGDREGARELSERLLAVAGGDDATHAWALGEIGRMELEAGDRERAAEALRTAVAIEGPRGESAERYRTLLGQHEPWQRYIDALRAHLGRGPQDPAAVYLDMARTQLTAMRNPDAALQTLEEAIGRHPEVGELALERGDVLVQTGRAPEAVEAFRGITRRLPTESKAWHGLVRALQEAGRPAEAALAAQAAEVLGDATDVERNLAVSRAPEAAGAQPGSLAHPTLRALGDEETDERVAELLGAHGDGLGKAFPPPFETYGVRKGDRIKARASHPVRQLVDRLTPIFGTEDFDLYVHAGLSGDVTVYPGETPSLMVPTYLSDLPERQQVFLMGRALAAVAGGMVPALSLAPGDLAVVVAAAVRRVVPGFEEGQHDVRQVQQLETLLAPSWFGRGRVDEVVQRYFADPVDIVSWAQAARRTVTLAAAIVAGRLDDCVVALEAVGEVQGPRADDPRVQALLQAWVSDRAVGVRRHARLL